MESKAAIDALAALAQDSRLAVFRLLVEQGPEGLPAGAIADRLGISPPTLSFHLNQLAQAGLARARRDGRSIIYAADYAAMNGLIAYLTENCCRGDPAGCVEACEPVSSTSRKRKGVPSHEAPARIARS